MVLYHHQLSLAQAMNPPFINTTHIQCFLICLGPNQTANTDYFFFRVGLLQKSTVPPLLPQANTFCMYFLKQKKGNWKKQLFLTLLSTNEHSWTIWQFPPLICPFSTRPVRAAIPRITTGTHIHHYPGELGGKSSLEQWFCDLRSISLSCLLTVFVFWKQQPLD